MNKITSQPPPAPARARAVALSPALSPRDFPPLTSDDLALIADALLAAADAYRASCSVDPRYDRWFESCANRALCLAERVDLLRRSGANIIY